MITVSLPKNDRASDGVRIPTMTMDSDARIAVTAIGIPGITNAIATKIRIMIAIVDCAIIDHQAI